MEKRNGMNSLVFQNDGRTKITLFQGVGRKKHSLTHTKLFLNVYGACESILVTHTVFFWHVIEYVRSNDQNVLDWVSCNFPKEICLMNKKPILFSISHLFPLLEGEWKLLCVKGFNQLCPSWSQQSTCRMISWLQTISVFGTFSCHSAGWLMI